MIVGALLLNGAGYASEQAWLKKTIDILQEPSSVLKDGQFMRAPSESQRKAAAEILQQSQQQAHRQKTTPQKQDISTEGTAVVFLSFSIPEAELKAILRRPQAVDTTYIFRGLAEGRNITGTMRKIQALIEGLDPQPRVTLDPERFTQYHIQQAPTLLYLGETAQQPLIATGTTNTKWIAEQAEQGRAGQLGNYGSTYPVAEQDLIETLKQAAANLDQKALADKAIDHYWDKYRFVTLTPAKKNREFLFDPSITVIEDILTQDGVLIAKKGQVINPLDTLPFTKTIVVFNPLIEKEYEYAVRQARAAVAEGRGVILLATQIRRESGWEYLQAIAQDFDYPVYLLNKQLQSRFNLQYTPSVIRQKGNALLIKEVALESS